MQEKAENRQALEEAKNQPFARYDIDAEADEELRMRDRFGDPLKLIKSSTVRSSIN